MGRYAVIPQLRAEIAELKDKLAKAREVEESSLHCLVRLANEFSTRFQTIERRLVKLEASPIVEVLKAVEPQPKDGAP